jgi:hypothetical protein
MFPGAMFDTPINQDDTAEIAQHEVSEDGVTWRSYDPVRDNSAPLLHQRIVFAEPGDSRT